MSESGIELGFRHHHWEQLAFHVLCNLCAQRGRPATKIVRFPRSTTYIRGDLILRNCPNCGGSSEHTILNIVTETK